jgi:hypothetical protein
MFYGDEVIPRTNTYESFMKFKEGGKDMTDDKQ